MNSVPPYQPVTAVNAANAKQQIYQQQVRDCVDSRRWTYGPCGDCSACKKNRLHKCTCTNTGIQGLNEVVQGFEMRFKRTMYKAAGLDAEKVSDVCPRCEMYRQKNAVAAAGSANGQLQIEGYPNAAITNGYQASSYMGYSTASGSTLSESFAPSWTGFAFQVMLQLTVSAPLWERRLLHPSL